MGEPLDRSNRVFGELTTFDKAFPNLEDAVIEYTEYNGFGPGRAKVWNLRNGGQVPCSNLSCRRGGYEFDHEVSKAVLENLTERSFSLRCRGDEGSPKGRKIGRRCMCRAEGTIKLRYKRAAQGNSQKDGAAH